MGSLHASIRFLIFSIVIHIGIGGPVSSNPEKKEDTSKENKLKLEVIDIVADPPSYVQSEDEPIFAVVSGHGVGTAVNEEYGYGVKGQVAGIAGGVHNDKGINGGGAAHAAGQANVDVEPIKGFVSVHTNGQATFNTYGETPEPFKHEIPNEDQIKSQSKLQTASKPQTASKSETAPKPQTASKPQIASKPKQSRPITQAIEGIPANPFQISSPNTTLNPFSPFTLPSVSETLGNILQPLTPPIIYNTLTGGISSTDVDSSETDDGLKQDSDTEESEVTPEEQFASIQEGFYNLIRPLTPSGITNTFTSFIKPLTSLSAQAQGAITLAGGAAYTGNQPEGHSGGIPGHILGGKPGGQSGGKPGHESGGKPGHESGGRPGHESGGRPGHQSGGRPGHQSGGKPGHQSGGKPGHQSGGKPGHHSGGKPGFHGSSKPYYPETFNAPEACINLCEKKGKGGGILINEHCICSCPAPEAPTDQLCCSGDNWLCDQYCRTNTFYKYTNGGECTPWNRKCECNCAPWDPSWEPEKHEVQSQHEQL